MKKLLYSLGLLGLLATVSCKDDDAVKPVTAEITFEGKAYTGRTGAVIDLGSDGTHYNYDFIVVDAVVSGDDFLSNELNGKFFFWPELYSPGTDKFRTGTFTYNEDPGNDDYYFNMVDLGIDSNNDGKLSAADSWYTAQGGTITVSGTPHNYTLGFDLTMNGGKKLIGSYTGTYQYFDESTERAPDSGGRRHSKIRGAKR